MADIVLINPRFEPSILGREYALPFLFAKAASPAASLPLLAALTPPSHRVMLVDENVEPIDFDRCARADIVGITGMIVQHRRMLEIISELKQRGAFVVLGGPLVTAVEQYFAELVDVIFIGEADMMAFKRSAQILQRSVAGSRRVYVPNAGHLTLLEDPGFCAAALREHLREQQELDRVIARLQGKGG